MKKMVFVILMAMACILIAGCSAAEEIMLNSPYTVDHKVINKWAGPSLELTVDGPVDDLLVILINEDREIESFIPREQMLASGKGKATFGLGPNPSQSYQVVIKESDPTKREGKTVYKGKIEFQSGKVVIEEVFVSGILTTTKVRVYNSGDLPVKIDYFMTYTAKGEKKSGHELRIGPKEYGEVTILYETERGGSIRLYAYSGGQVIAEYEGIIR